MKYLSPFFENSSDEFNLELRVAKIREKYSSEEVEKMFNDEWPKWVDDNWADDGVFGSDRHWYDEIVGDEAQLFVLEINLIDDDSLTDEQRELLNAKLIEEYPVLAIKGF